ncbi:molecular chaperone TorD [Corticimicrobacter populi]|uniref:Molecular chaperone TorD n=1 Tax=Corticimicrobacter populi TaxID=2175229 RepID=A0A2V1JTY4_9BURK|nr:molecular chaperone TorD [Corticimicrobacter populi]PWF21251.1 molecular chaperone TorD [Corticimicrobacter populi]
MSHPLSLPSLALDEWHAVATQRARIYSWFSGLYAAELTQAHFDTLQTGSAASLCDSLAAAGLTGEVARLRAAMTAWHNLPLARLELAADFAQMFLLSARDGAPPYASCYDDAAPQLYGQAETRMRSFLEHSALAVDARFREPADHLAVCLAMMHYQLIQPLTDTDNAVAASAHQQAGSLETYLLGWLPAFEQRSQSCATELDFYPALATLLLAFVRQDHAFLRDIADDAAQERV